MLTESLSGTTINITKMTAGIDLFSVPAGSYLKSLTIKNNHDIIKKYENYAKKGSNIYEIHISRGFKAFKKA